MNKSPFDSNHSNDARDCRAYARVLDAYLDGELDAAQLIEIEGHVATCEICHERVELDRAMRGTLKKAVREGAMIADTSARDRMRARALTAMAAEKSRGKSQDVSGEAPVDSWFGWKTMAPLTAAAALAVVWGAVSHGQAAKRWGGLAGTDEMSAGITEDPLSELVAAHARPLPPSPTDLTRARSFEEYVGVPVHPGKFEKAGARLVDGRVLPLRHERAAMLQYEVGNGPSTHRVSVFIYDPSKIQVGCNGCAPRSVGTSQVQVGVAHGYSVAVMQRAGVGYAVASDLDEEQSAKLAALADTD